MVWREALCVHGRTCWYVHLEPLNPDFLRLASFVRSAVMCTFLAFLAALMLTSLEFFFVWAFSLAICSLAFFASRCFFTMSSSAWYLLWAHVILHASFESTLLWRWSFFLKYCTAVFSDAFSEYLTLWIASKVLIPMQAVCVVITFPMMLNDPSIWGPWKQLSNADTI